jgi:enoyl-CoA hydratase/carnithine racemase
MIGSSNELARAQTTTQIHAEQIRGCTVLRLSSPDGTNRLKISVVAELGELISELARDPKPLIITGNDKFFSVGADLNEMAAHTSVSGYRFSRLGQAVMDQLDRFPALTIAAISGNCFGGAIDMALACDLRICAPNAVFGHRGAALGLLTGWGGTQRLPRLIGKARALQMFSAAEKLGAQEALRIGLIDAIADDPVNFALERIQNFKLQNQN